MSSHQRAKLRAGTTFKYVLEDDRLAGNLDSVFLINVLSIDDDERLSEAREEYVEQPGREAFRKMLEIAVAGHQVPGQDGQPVTALVTKSEGMQLIRACIEGNNLTADERKKHESQHTSQAGNSASDAGASAATE